MEISFRINFVYGFGALLLGTTALYAGCSSGSNNQIPCQTTADCTPYGSALTCDTSVGLCTTATTSTGGAGTGGSGTGGAGTGGSGTGGAGTGGSGTGGSGTGGAGTGGAGTGGAGTGGTGTGGSSGCVATLIDDMEGGLNGFLPECDGRMGSWWTVNDEVIGTSQTPVVDQGFSFPYSSPGYDSSWCVATYGTTAPATTTGAWGAIIGFDLNRGASSALAFDAASRGYTGVSFWARKSDSLATSVVFFRVSDRYTHPDGGLCNEALDGCFDDWGVWITGLSTAWQHYTFLWSQLTDRLFVGDFDNPIDPSALFGMQWSFESGEDFDIQIDQVEFTQ